MSSWRRFARDERGELGWLILQIAILLLIPLALLFFWIKYLRRIQADTNAKEGAFVWGGGKSTAQAAPSGDQQRQCRKCGLTVRPPRGSGPPTCPNCMSVL